MGTGRKLLVVSLVLLASAVLAAGCSDDSTNPAAPTGPLLFSGRVGADTSVEHDFIMPSDGIATMRINSIDLVLFDITQGDLDNVLIGLALGQRDEDQECVVTSNFAIGENQITVFRLEQDDYCISMFNVGGFPEDAVVDYAVEVTFTL